MASYESPQGRMKMMINECLRRLFWSRPKFSRCRFFVWCFLSWVLFRRVLTRRAVVAFWMSTRAPSFDIQEFVRL